MKRLNTKEGQYGVRLGLFMGIFATIIGTTLAIEIPDTCTPTTEHKEVMATLSGIQQSLEMQISELPLSVNCNK